ncbi:MAG: hypothetical protein ACFN4T_07085 [Peptidiphaga sp.]
MRQAQESDSAAMDRRIRRRAIAGARLRERLAGCGRSRRRAPISPMPELADAGDVI